MDTPSPPACTAFLGLRRLASGPAEVVAAAVRRIGDAPPEPVTIFDDATGRVVDLDLRPMAAPPLEAEPTRSEEARPRGRPKLGVVAREVTLLPRHWEWLAAQPGGASVALRKLVEEARRAGGEKDRTRASREAAYRFISALAGDLPGFEEASRALFAGDAEGFTRRTDAWPQDIADYALKLAAGAWGGSADA